MDLTEKTLNEKTIYNGRIIRLHVDNVELPDGTKSTREVVEHNGGVCVAALTNENELLFVRQFRYPYHCELDELPAGKLEKGEDPLSAGLRELEEECGVKANNVRSMGKLYPTVAYCSEVIHLYLATDLVESHQHLDDEEFLSVKRIKLCDAVKMVMDGSIKDAKTQALVLKTAVLLFGEHK